MPGKPARRAKIGKTDTQSQLEQAYDIAKTTYTLTLQIISIAAAAVAGLATAAFQLRSAPALFFAGGVLIILVYQLGIAGRTLAAALSVARRLELQLGLLQGTSPIAAVYAALQGRDQLARLEALSAIPKKGVTDPIQDASKELSLFKIRGTTGMALIAGIAALIVGAALWIFGWPEAA